MPGAKSMYPLNYFESVDAAMLTIPSTAEGRYLFEFKEECYKTLRAYNVTLRNPNSCILTSTSTQYLTYSIVLASIEARILSLRGPHS
jgi:hypothetical protein